MFTRPIRLASGILAFQEQLNGTWIDYVPGGRRLVVTFENAAPPRDTSAGRDPWQLEPARAAGCSVIGVKTREATWYREPDLHAFFRDPVFRAFCRRFESCLFYGSSMGGYAALAFSGAVPGSGVLAYNPQTTLDPRIVPWETRFRAGRTQSWDGDFADARDSAPLARRIYVTYDPFLRADVGHVERLAGDNLVRLRTPFAGHVTATMLNGLGVMNDVFMGALTDKMADYPAWIRGRRRLAGYYAQFGRRARHPGMKRRLFEMALARKADHVEARHGMMTLLIEEGRFAEALAFHDGHYKGNDTARLTAVKIGLLAGHCYLAQGDREAARRVMTQALAAAPVDPALIPALHALADRMDAAASAEARAWSDAARRHWALPGAD